MSIEDRIKAGIDGKLANRMQIRGYNAEGDPIPAIRYAPVEDGIREEFWLDRIEGSANKGGGGGERERGWFFVGPCTAPHFRRKPRGEGTQSYLQVFYPESLSEMTPELY